MTILKICGEKGKMYATLNWTKSVHDGNSPITAYKASCKRNDSRRWFSNTVGTNLSAHVFCTNVFSLNLASNSVYAVELTMKVSVTNSFGTTSSVVTHVKLWIRRWNALSRVEIPVLNPASFRPSNAGRVSHKYPRNPRASSLRGRHYGAPRVVPAM